MNMDTTVGKTLPTMSFEVDGGKSLNLPGDWAGKWTVLYFYPKDDTPGCTKQACGYRDNINAFTQMGVQVYGVSADDLTSHAAFRDKFSLNFPLIFDKDKKLATYLGAVKPEGGISRDTFLVDPKGTVKFVWRKVSPEATIQETLNAAKESVATAR